MAQSTWEIRGDYTETCSCEYLCPCILADGTMPATEEFCKVSMAFKIDRGHYREIMLDGLAFVVMAQSPKVMADGNWRVGLIIDSAATAEQREALQVIASGQGGGPMSGFVPFIGEFLGVEFRPIDYGIDRLSRSVTAEGLLDQAVLGMASSSADGEAIAIDNTFHAANKRLNLARATRSHMHAFGIDWDDTSGTRNGHFAPFHWCGSAN
jgi:hypothetical protein